MPSSRLVMDTISSTLHLCPPAPPQIGGPWNGNTPSLHSFMVITLKKLVHFTYIISILFNVKWNLPHHNFEHWYLRSFCQVEMRHTQPKVVLAWSRHLVADLLLPNTCLNKTCWWKMVYWKMSTHYFCGIKYHTTNGNGVSIQNPKYWYLEGAKHWVWPSCLYGLTYIITLCPSKLVDFVTGGLIWHRPTIVLCVWAYLFIILFFI